MSSTPAQDLVTRTRSSWYRFLTLSLLLLSWTLRMRAQTAHSVGEITTFGSGFSNPHGIVMDPAGNLYVADYGSGHVYQEALQADGSYLQSVLFPGNGYGSAIGLARDSVGNFYVAGNGVVTKQTLQPDGGYTASTVGNFTHPVGVAVDTAGDLFVVDDNESSLYELRAGSYTQTTLDADTLPTPFAVSIDSLGNLYVGTVQGPYVEKYTLTNGTYTKSNVLDAPSTYGVISDAFGNLFYAGPSQFLKATLLNGTYTEQVYSPYRVQALTQGPDRQLYAVSYFETTGVRFNTAPSFGSVPVGTTAARQVSINFTIDTAGTFANPAVLTQGAAGLDFSLASTTCSGELPAQSGCTVTVAFQPTVPGLRLGGVALMDRNGNVIASAPVNGIGTAPQGVIYPGTQSTLASGLGAGVVAVDGGGNVYAASSDGVVVKETRNSGGYTQSTVASGIGTPTALAVDGLGNLFIADSTQQQVMEEIYQPGTNTYTQTNLFTGSANGLGQVRALAVDGSGAVYLGNGTELLKETPYGNGYIQSVVSAEFSSLTALAVDDAGNLFAADSRAGSVYKETPGTGGAYTQTTVATGLGVLNGLALDAAGTLYITAPGTADGVLRYESASAGLYTPGSTIPGFRSPGGVAVDGVGNLYVTATSDGTVGITRLDVADLETLTFPELPVGKTSAAQSVTLTNIGNAALNLSGITTSSGNFTVDAAAATCTVSGSLAVAASCVAGVDFTPQLAGPLSGTLNLTDNTLNGSGAVQQVRLNASGSGVPAITVSSLSTVYGTANTVLTVMVSYAGTVAPSGGVTLVVDNGLPVNAICSAANSVLTCTGTYPTATRAVGAHTITAVQAGDLYYTTAGGTGTLTVTAVVTPGFAFTNSGTTTATISAGGNTTFQFQLSPLGSGFPGEVSFAVNGLPSQATYTITPTLVSASAGQQTVLLSVQTAAPKTTDAAKTVKNPPWGKGAAVLTAMLLPFGLGRASRRRRERVTLALAALFSVAAITSLTGCGFSGVFYQAPASYVITITATSGSLQHNATVNLTMQ